MIKFKLGVIEDAIDKEQMADYDLGRADAPDELLAFWSDALARLETHEAFTNPKVVNEDLLGTGYAREKDDVTVEVYLCSRASLNELASAEGAMGCHWVTTHDMDPMGDESAYSRVFRILVVSDKAEFLAMMQEEAIQDINPSAHRFEYLAAYLNTVFHEIGHVALFAENSGMLPPHEIDLLSDAGEIGCDIFDCSTGYGIRPLPYGEDLHWADNPTEASEMMEEFVEELGKTFMNFALKDACDMSLFPAAMGVENEFNAVTSAHCEATEDVSFRMS